MKRFFLIFAVVWGIRWLRWDQEFITYTAADGLATDCVQALCEDGEGRLWIGTGFYNTTGAGVSCYDGRRFVTYTTEDGLAHNHVWDIFCDSQGQLWFGTLSGGLYRYDGRHFQHLTTADGLPYNSVTGLVPQPDGSMVISTYRGIAHYRPTATIPPGIEIREALADEIYQNPTELELTTTGAHLLTI